MCGRTRVEVASQGRSAAARRSGPRRHARGGLLAGGAAASAAARVGRGSRRPLWSTYTHSAGHRNTPIWRPIGHHDTNEGDQSHENRPANVGPPEKGHAIRARGEPDSSQHQNA